MGLDQAPRPVPADQLSLTQPLPAAQVPVQAVPEGQREGLG